MRGRDLASSSLWPEHKQKPKPAQKSADVLCSLLVEFGCLVPCVIMQLKWSSCVDFARMYTAKPHWCVFYSHVRYWENAHLRCRFVFFSHAWLHYLAYSLVHQEPRTLFPRALSPLTSMSPILHVWEAGVPRGIYMNAGRTCEPCTEKGPCVCVNRGPEDLQRESPRQHRVAVQTILSDDTFFFYAFQLQVGR